MQTHHTHVIHIVHEKGQSKIYERGYGVNVVVLHFQSDGRMRMWQVIKVGHFSHKQHDVSLGSFKINF